MEGDLTTADVYEHASLIGQDIEKVFDRFGHDARLDMMPKIIRVLEQLEVLVGEREKGKQALTELKMDNERLYLEVKREASQRRKLDEELYPALQSGETESQEQHREDSADCPLADQQGAAGHSPSKN